MKRSPSYFRSPQIGGASPRDTEILAFRLCNERLEKAAAPRERIEALNKTHQLWSLLVKDLQSDGNRLPGALKEQLIGLGFWAMTYSTCAIAEDLPVQPLIDVHTNIIDGLRAQEVASPNIQPNPRAQAMRPFVA